MFAAARSSLRTTVNGAPRPQRAAGASSHRLQRHLAHGARHPWWEDVIPGATYYVDLHYGKMRLQSQEDGESAISECAWINAPGSRPCPGVVGGDKVHGFDRPTLWRNLSP